MGRPPALTFAALTFAALTFAALTFAALIAGHGYETPITRRNVAAVA